MQYFYKLGHCPQLAEAEFSFQTQDVDFRANLEWLVSSKKVDIQKLGSIVYSGQVLKQFDNKVSQSEVWEVVQDFIKTNTQINFKKLGLAFPNFLQRQAFAKLKPLGVKKINLLKNPALPNFGHLKSTPNWLIIFYYNSKLTLGYIENYFNQELFAKLDKGLPAGDMWRGLINLKLARSLMNLTKRKKIWDPFAGVGRNAFGSLDIKDEFWLSDIDTRTTSQIEENLNYMNSKNIFKEIKARVNKPFVLDATRLDQAPKDLVFEDLAIVTEGNLGRNFTKKPTKDKIYQELENLELIYKPFFTKAKKLKIAEIIITFPVYFLENGAYKKTILPLNLIDIAKSNSYKNTNLIKNKPMIIYSREKSFVGHGIVKFDLET